MFFDSGVLVPMMMFAIPIVAVAGGITAGIVKTVSRHRLIELAQRERIAAIERGLDPGKLPPMPSFISDDEGAPAYMTLRQATIHRSRGLLIGGIITLSVGIGLGVMLYFIEDGNDKNVWAVGAIPALVGLALLLSSFLYSRFAADDAAASPKN
jgi:hypothetical protein